ncbi:MAG TPA: protein-L-isoaspartate(D-aspartate) O-methyltransferase [Allosphingosinicella sp.]|jgi:protein-L-isoaspartate(D-aspartate) O-methyltransferase|uniref:protein-L-isoaspartate(D-aspartate) O-methyltransferase n=1 Tax=Allosphingosinicella sp. TaxID=2823234 RepID=UPI002F2718E1
MKPMTEKHLAVFRRHMVEVVDLHFDLASDEIGKEELDPDVREAMLRVPRHLFVPGQLAALSYHDGPLPIGFDKTISQPFIAALMLDMLEVRPGHHILEVGTGLGYQAALLASLRADVWSVEVVEEFAGEASQRLLQLGFQNVRVRVGDGSRGWPEHAPFDRILVTAAAKTPPQALFDQLKPGGRMVVPLGGKDVQQLSVVTKGTFGQTETREVMAVRFTQLETAA